MNAVKYHSVVKENGTIELPRLPFPKGVKVEIIILPEESFEMIQAAESSLKFWDNQVDDAVWNDA